MLRAAIAIALCAQSSRAAADDGELRPSRPIHGSIGGGGSLLLSGARGDRLRLDLAIDIKPRSRYGVLLAARGIDLTTDPPRHGLVLAGVIFEAASARPRLYLDLHGSVGFDLDARSPVLGGGLRTTLTVYKWFGIATDLGAYLVVDGFEDTRLQIQSTTFLVARW